MADIVQILPKQYPINQTAKQMMTRNYTIEDMYEKLNEIVNAYTTCNVFIYIEI